MKINLAGVQIATGQKAQETELAELRSKLEAIEKSQAVIEFDLEGRIVSANNNFLNTMGYMLDEVIGQHHSIFVDSDYAASNEYIQFWDRLRNGQFETAEFRRVAKDGSHVWIQATYTPIRDRNGNITKVVKFATDITATKLANSNYQGQIDAIHKAQAVIEFELDGTIITANENFLTTMGYSLNEVKGQHHSMFAPPGLKDSIEYREFWDLLGQGQYQAGEFKRISKAGKDVWIQASYNPILDTDGNPIKVVKFASDITESKRQAANFHGQINAIHKAQAVIEFGLDGTILTANENFLGAMGYGLDEVQGKHHSLFVDSEAKASSEYQQFWQDLAAGNYKAGEFKRVNKAGKDIWIQASYNPILDTEGRPFKVVKFASDITESKRQAANFQGQIDAIHKAQAVIEFELDGTIITANDNFLGAMGYRLDEVQGKHHAMFVDGDTKSSSEYKQFWQDLASGNYQAGEFKRVNKTGDDVWIQASYNPILDSQGRPFKVVKFASDITASKLQAANFQGQINAIHKAQAVIEFELDGTILTANENFLATMGYSLDEVKGQHHSMFAPPGMKESAEYREFWESLGKGEYQAGEFKRVDKANKDVWIQASYNPILDADGKPFKVVKFATDITESKRQSANFQGQINAIHKAQAVIEFELDGTILTANENFLTTMGYSLDEVKGKHHSMFAPPGLKDSQEYRDFWALLGKGEYQAGEFKRVGKSGDDIWIQASYNPILDSEGQPFKVVKFASDITAQKAQAEVNAQNADISSALKLCNANVMLADNDLNVVYLNDGMEAMLKEQEQQLQTELPQFNVGTLIGTCVDVFHKDPSIQRRFIGGIDKTETSRLKLAGFTYDLTTSPWLNVEGERIGTVVEWYDLTEELAAQEQERAKAEANARIKLALDTCQANVMLADNDLNIIYLNDAVSRMMHHNEQKLREALPSFNANKLIGTCVDDFHQNPSHQRAMIQNLNASYKTKIRISGLTFDLVATPVITEEGERLGTVVEWSDITQELAAKEKADAIAQENARIRQALDNVSTNTMIANADNEIIYMNAAIDDMMSTAEKDIKTVLPNFSADSLIGECMDVFHKSPAHQRDMINRLETTYSTEIKVGPRTFGLIANPIRDKDNSRIGTVVEWNDRTEEVAIEREIADLITAAGDGDLSSRIEEEGKSGFFLNLAGGLNQLVSIADGVVTETVEMLDAMAHGDLTKRINSDYKGAFDKLKNDANSTAEKLTEVIGRISNASSAVASGAEEIAQGNTDLSQRTEEQASSLEETASSMEQMTSTVRQNADNAKVANDLAADATNKAQKGGDVVKRAVNSMSEINESSKKIADIIGVIDEIAFQTNLLALNAAVEAARAGEQGRGFAVVAGEVRNLAQRSAAAAKEIKDLIRDSVAKVQDGSQLVNESGATLNEIVEAISRVTTMIADISNASNEQSEGIEQVNKAVTQMDEMTQQNAALVEEASAAGEAMADQARGMKQILGFFNANGSGGQLASLPPMAPSSAPIAAPVAAAPVAIESPSSSMDFADDDEEWEEF